MDMYSVVSKNPLLAIMRNVPLEKTIDYADAVVNGGIPFFEVALNSTHGLKQIRMLRDHFGDSCMIGAGTAITIERVKAALDAGAQFLLTPGTPPDVLEYCARHDIMLLPGVLTPCDVATALEFGFRTMKLFPAGSMPRSYVKDLKGPFDNTNYMAIGGVSPDNIHEFFEAGCISAGLASSLMPKSVVENGNWEEGSAYIRDLVKRALGQ
ncbi:bifunctional 4-hydroxy-2-oxoglutarate aldolase/2-dehydro-3-deoxy-phosphogluconate aldolase [Lachnospiraceae bacterium JLR.KK008]